MLFLGILPFPGALAQQAPLAQTSRADVAARPGDKVRLRIYREPDLSGEFTVPEDGSVDFPKIGPVPVDRISTDSLRALLIAEYSHSLRDPAIEVTVLRRVNVTGAVRNPGFYYADPTVTVKGALALAGGVTPEGNKNKLELQRGNQRTGINLSGGTSLADSPVHSGSMHRRTGADMHRKAGFAHRPTRLLGGVPAFQVHQQQRDRGRGDAADACRLAERGRLRALELVQHLG